MYWRLSQGCLRQIGCRGMSRRFAIRSRDKYRCTLVQRYPGVPFFRMRMPSMAREAREACEVCRDKQLPREVVESVKVDVPLVEGLEAGC